MHNDRLVTFFPSFVNRKIIMFSSDFHEVSACDIINSVFALSL